MTVRAVSPAGIEKTIVRLLSEREPGKTICPSEVARAMAGSDQKAWRLLMKPIRTEAVRMADAGEIVITRKGRAVDPHDFKGIYRIGAGKSASVRPPK